MVYPREFHHRTDMERKHELAMPADYFKDTVRPQLCSLLEEDSLKDITIILRASSVNMSSCILSLLSPVLRTMVCGKFRESIHKQIYFPDVHEESLLKLLRLACGKEGLMAEDAEQLLELGELAERLQMEAVRKEVEHKLLKELKLEDCPEMIQKSEAIGLQRLPVECYKMLRDEFAAVCQNECFLSLSEETMGNLLDEDELGVDREEDVLKALLWWMRNNDEGMRREELLSKIRYGAVSNDFLGRLALLPGHGMLKEIAGEAMAKKEGGVGTGGIWDGVERLCDKWRFCRMKAGIIGADVLKRPANLAVDQQGRVVVADLELHSIIVFHRDGSVARCLDSAAVGKLDRPMCVAVDRHGHIIIADYRKHCIQAVNADGLVTRCFGCWGRGLGQLNGPCGLAIDREGHIVVADTGNNRIQVFHPNGCVVRHFGSRGAGVGQLDSPAGVAVDNAGRIVVADKGNHRVQIFNGDGTVALCFGSGGDGPGQLCFPEGVAVDHVGRIVVADTGNDRIQVFNPDDGSVARVIGSSGGRVGELRHPCRVVVHGSGRIVVVEGGQPGPFVCNHRVQVL